MIEQQYAMTMLLIMTVTNVFLGIAMVAGFIPIEYGMSLAFFAMCGIIWKCKVDLMGNVRLWENPKQYRERMDNRILRGRFEEDK
jgi:hypothetical protein